jgi:peptidoglycan/LPS O-acetylase OafA/YrhL
LPDPARRGSEGSAIPCLDLTVPNDNDAIPLIERASRLFVRAVVWPKDKYTGAYRADIDGLRALSILLVIGYHADFVPGGFVGVDIFFVISGFLITRIILTQMEAGRFSPMEFYARRIRRIFPALIVVLAATYLIGWLVLLPDAFSLLGKSTAAGVAFVSNVFQLTQLGYFAPDAAENPLLHLWSLGIEEQFYIFWPPVLLMLCGSRRRSLWIASIATASFGVSLLIFFGYKEWSFYSPISRAWELLAGGIIANRSLDRPEREVSSGQFDNLLATIGLAAIIAAAIWLKKESLFPGLYALLPVFGAVFIIISPNAWVNRVLLSSRPMVLTGLISYPLYLWHWPLLSYLGILRSGDPTLPEIWAAIIVAFTLAWATARFVEVPLREQPNAVPRLFFGLIAVGVAGILTANASGFGFRFAPEIRDIALIPPRNNDGFRDACFPEARDAQPDPGCIEQGTKPLLFVWGDSTAAALTPGLEKAEQTVPFRLAHFAAPACAPILATGSFCDTFNDRVFGSIKSLVPETVVLHAMWDKNDDLGKLRETVEKLRAVHVPRIVILGPVPVWKRPLPLSLVNFYRLRHTIADRLSEGVSGPANDERMEAFSKAAGVEYISAWHILCNSDGCMTRLGSAADDVVATDIVHLSNAGSKFLIAAIGERLFPRP